MTHTCVSLQVFHVLTNYEISLIHNLCKGDNKYLSFKSQRTKGDYFLSHLPDSERK